MEPRVGARAGDVTRVVDLVARGEPGDLGARRHHGARGVEAEDAPRVGVARADLGVHRVDRHCPHLDEEVAGAGLGDLDSVRRDLDTVLDLEVTAVVCTKLHLKSYSDTRTGVAGVQPAAWQFPD